MDTPPKDSPLYDPFMIFLELGSYFPAEVASLFQQPSKKDLEKYLKNFELTTNQLARAIHAAGKGGYRHDRFHFEHVPAELQKRSENLGTLLKEKEIAEVCGIMNGVFEQRKLVTAHLFENPTEWHIFYCDQRDIAEGKKANWKGGSHWHFVNHRFGNNLKKEDIWAALQGSTERPFTGVHVKFKPGHTENWQDDQP